MRGPYLTDAELAEIRDRHDNIPQDDLFTDPDEDTP